MNYTITPGGIVYHLNGTGQDYRYEEAQTDRVSDEQSEPKPIPIDEAVETCKQISARIEAMDVIPQQS